MKIEPDLRLHKNLGEVNDKEGGQEKKAENLCLPSCISYLMNYKQKTHQKTTCTFSIIMKMSNKKYHLATISWAKVLGTVLQYSYFSVISPIGSLLKQCILFEIFLQFSLPPACHMHALFHFSVIDVITCVLIFFE